MPTPNLTDKEARTLYLLNQAHYGWNDPNISTIEPDRLIDAYSSLELEEIRRRLPSFVRKGFARTPQGYERGKAFELLPALEEAWKRWMTGGGFNKIEEFTRG